MMMLTMPQGIEGHPTPQVQTRFATHKDLILFTLYNTAVCIYTTLRQSRVEEYLDIDLVTRLAQAM